MGVSLISFIPLNPLLVMSMALSKNIKVGVGDSHFGGI